MAIVDELKARVVELPDSQALAVLALVLEHQTTMPGPFELEAEQQRLVSAISQSEIMVETSGGPEIVVAVDPVLEATDGDLARTALTYLVESDLETASLIDRAMDLDLLQGTRDVGLLMIGALVLMAFHADIEVARDPEKGWKFHFKATGITEATIGKLLSELMGNFLNRPR